MIGTLATASGAQSLPSDLDAYVKRTMEAFRVPGLSIAVVKDGKPLLVKGYGVTRTGSADPVTADTLFGIASNTKVFTATMLAILVDEGKLHWEDRVQEYLPAFALSDPFVSHEMTVRDLLVHRSGLGLGGGDLLWWPGTTYTPEEVISRLRYVPLKTSFRSAYAYDNVLYLVAGQLIEKVTGRPWKEVVAERILRKAGMTNSATSYEGARKESISHTHAVVEGKLQEVAPFTASGPAGGIMSSANDMAKWLTVQLAHGALPQGGRLFSERQSSEVWSLTTPIPVTSGPLDGAFGEIRPYFAGYALGLVTRDYRGRRMLTHTGGLPGFVSMVSMLPEENVGIVVLTNQESEEAYQALVFRIQDALLGAKPVDWAAEFQARIDRAQARRESASPETKRVRGTHPSLGLDDYAGTYRDRWYGDVTVAKEGDRLVMRFSKTPRFIGDLEPWHYDTFLVRWRDRSLQADAFVTFTLDAQGKVESARMIPYDDTVDFSYDFQDLSLKRVND